MWKWDVAIEKFEWRQGDNGTLLLSVGLCLLVKKGKNRQTHSKYILQGERKHTRKISR
ncbi:MAG: hypothetical protein WDM76_04885 [Limisphaerales bacterium]